MNSDFNSNEDSLCPECKSGKLVLADGKYTCGVCGLIKDEYLNLNFEEEIFLAI